MTPRRGLTEIPALIMVPGSARLHPTALREVVITDELRMRNSRAGSLTEENDAFHALSRAFKRSPEAVLQELLQSALRICGAGTAGVSALEELPEGGSQFRWIALEGVLKAYVGGTTPTDESPCGYTLRAGTPQLFRQPGRHFTCLAAAVPAIHEGLVVPIVYDGVPLGTIWIVSHSAKASFDLEDARVMESLAGFAGLAVNLLCREGKCSADRAASGAGGAE